VQTAATAHAGSIPSAGPAVTGAFGPGGLGGRGGATRGGAAFVPGAFGGTGTGAGTGTGGTATGTSNGTGTGTGAGGTGAAGGSAGTGGTGTGGLPGGFPPGGSGGGIAGTGTGTGTGTGASNGAGSRFGGFPGSRRGGEGGFGAGGFGGAGGGAVGGGGGLGGLSGSTQVDSALIKLLEAGASKYTWIAATEGSQEAAPIELASGGEAVMAIGGFNGSDPAPTLAQFEAMVASHEIHYYVGRGSSSFGGGTGSSSIESWVAAHFTAKTVGGTTVYDLTQPAK
jgi:hypothetical protein